MAKDYFQDIIPPEEEPRRAPPREREEEYEEEERAAEPPPSRSIRNISAPSRIRPQAEHRMPAGGPPLPIRRRRKGSRWVLWLIALIVILILIGFGLFMFQTTTVTVVPRSQIVTFDQNSQYTAYPAATAATDTLTYTVKTLTLNESQTVPSQGTEHADVKASGTITVYNDYSTAPVNLVATTRFETPDGLIFRTPEKIVVPGKKGSTPGSVSVTVVADQPGAQYNVGPISKFTVPGLTSSPKMYDSIWAASTASTTGGFSGDRPAAAPGAVDSAISTLRAKLQAEAASSSVSTATTTVLSDLVKITYQDMPQTTEQNNGIGIHEKATVQIPEVSTAALAQTLAQGVSADAEQADLSLVPKQGFDISVANASTTTLGTEPINFTLSGAAQLVWNIDTGALAKDLAGKQSGAFQTVTSGYSSIQEAHARIMPPWSHTFPADPSDIKVVVEAPESQN